ncbi:rhodanese-like domain-containing protein [Pseudanabaena sp. FACHB-1277]|jgi:rhodanese-related sulfurtransferase|uniref:Rhodanese-like domain-containing protein n=1 Tax=Pseudanabaena cinerea FACHB-1277 TaxID=2949581 RepID=A0A926Z837_9CYAN|nr:rhodanese-like domain-containing protein [Pseudanabaena cinerea]MBD2152435.1 rhodanese-like domain-containing protein [Pseudanabaena cinerea FACHB-1277]
MTTSQNLTSVSESQIKLIDVQDLKKLIDRQAVELIDVREADEFASERIDGAVLVPLSNFDPQQISLNSDKQLVLYCRSSNRSAQAAAKLIDAGFAEVTHLKGGIMAWRSQGMPIKANKNAPISIMRQVQITAGSLVFLGTVLSATVSPWFMLLTGFVGAGLMFAGISNTCAMANLLSMLPYNKQR